MTAAGRQGIAAALLFATAERFISGISLLVAGALAFAFTLGLAVGMRAELLMMRVVAAQLKTPTAALATGCSPASSHEQ